MQSEACMSARLYGRYSTGASRRGLVTRLYIRVRIHKLAKVAFSGSVTSCCMHDKSLRVWDEKIHAAYLCIRKPKHTHTYIYAIQGKEENDCVPNCAIGHF